MYTNVTPLLYDVTKIPSLQGTNPTETFLLRTQFPNAHSFESIPCGQWFFPQRSSLRTPQTQMTPVCDRHIQLSLGIVRNGSRGNPHDAQVPYVKWFCIHRVGEPTLHIHSSVVAEETHRVHRVTVYMWLMWLWRARLFYLWFSGSKGWFLPFKNGFCNSYKKH